MRKPWVLGLALLTTAMACGSVPAASRDEKAAREELQAWYAKIVDSYRKKDLQGYMALFAQDVTMRDAKGKTTDRRALEAFAEGDMAATGKIHSAKLEITKLALKGQQATVVGSETWKYVFTDLKGEFGPKGKAYDVVWHAPSRGKFLKTSQGWLAQSREATGPETFTAGGKPLVPLAPSKKRKK